MQITTCSVAFFPDHRLLSLIDAMMSKIDQKRHHISHAQITIREDTHSLSGKITEIRLIGADTIFFVCERKQTFEASVIAAISSLKRYYVRWSVRNSRHSCS